MIKNRVFPDDPLAQLSGKVVAGVRPVQTRAADKPDVVFRNTRGVQLLQNRFGDWLYRRSPGQVVKHNDDLLRIFCQLTDGSASYGVPEALADLFGGQCAALVAPRGKKLHIPVVWQGDRSWLVSIPPVLRQSVFLHEKLLSVSAAVNGSERFFTGS